MRDCIIKVKDSVEKSYSMGATAAFITDHDSLSGHVKFWNEADKIRKKGEKLYEANPTDENYRMANFKAVLGNEIYLAKEGSTAETWVKGDRFHHLVLLAKDRIGWAQLNELSTRAWSRSFKRAVTRVPTYLSDLDEIVGANPGHLIASSACLGNYMGERILQFSRTKDEYLKLEVLEYINHMKTLFGEDFYLEIQPAEYEDQITYNNWLKTFAEHAGVELVVATDNHYLNAEDRMVHHAFLNAQLDLQSERETDKFYKYTYFQTIDEVNTFLGLCENLSSEDIQSAIDNTFVIADKCSYYSIQSDISVPSVTQRNKGWEDIIHTYDSKGAMFKQYSHSINEMDKYFLYKIIKGIDEKIEDGVLLGSEEEFDRVNTELFHIWKISETIGQRLGNYFNTMQEMLLKIWEISIVGPGRGSAVGYLINFILDITQVNPLTTPEPLPYWR